MDKDELANFLRWFIKGTQLEAATNVNKVVERYVELSK